MAFAILMTQAGQDFVKKCREAGKEICVWTVNHPDEMRMAMQWGVKAVLTDKVGAFVQLQQEVRVSSLHEYAAPHLGWLESHRLSKKSGI